MLVFGTLKYAVWMYSHSRSRSPFHPSCSEYPFYASRSTHRLAPQGCFFQSTALPICLYFFLFEKLDYLPSTFEYEAEATEIINYWGNIKQPRGLLWSLNLNTVKALILLRSLSVRLLIEGLIHWPYQAQAANSNTEQSCEMEINVPELNVFLSLALEKS